MKVWKQLFKTGKLLDNQLKFSILTDVLGWLFSMWEDVYHIILSGKNSNVYEILHIVNLNFVLIVFFFKHIENTGRNRTKWYSDYSEWWD